MSFHSGFVCILGRPNAGKSTLLNALVGEKLAIISPKPQTTRNRILGIINVPKQKGDRKEKDAGQIVLIDTPGVHQSGSSLGRKMMSEVREALEGCELILMIVDATRKWDRDDARVLDLAKKAGTNAGTAVFLLLNKIDLLADKSKLLPLIAEFQTLHDFKEIVPISALKKKGLDELLACVLKALPKGPRYFPEDQITDQPVRFMAAELIREHVLMQTHEEVPHAVSVAIEQFEESPKLTRIAAVIYCERDGQKAILIRQRRPDAEEDRNRSPSRHRENGRDKSFLGALRQDQSRLARFAQLRRRTGLAPPNAADWRPAGTAGVNIH